jgi:hypothetical protein
LNHFQKNGEGKKGVSARVFFQMMVSDTIGFYIHRNGWFFILARQTYHKLLLWSHRSMSGFTSSLPQLAWDKRLCCGGANCLIVSETMKRKGLDLSSFKNGQGSGAHPLLLAHRRYEGKT